MLASVLLKYLSSLEPQMNTHLQISPVKYDDQCSPQLLQTQFLSPDLSFRSVCS